MGAAGTRHPSEADPLSTLRRSYELRIPDMIGIAVDPLFDTLHDHPGFQQLVRDLVVALRHS